MFLLPKVMHGLYEYKRSEFEGFPVAVVGDVGTCKINRSVKQRNPSACQRYACQRSLVRSCI